jgi:hypothetical protein
MMGHDDRIVEDIGRPTVLGACTKLGCSVEMQHDCVPHSGHVDLCKECIDAVKRGKQWIQSMDL